MGYPKYASGLKPVCMRVTKLKPMTVVEQRGDQKSIKVLVSELNPPICALIKEMAQGGTQGSVPITFASTASLARLCPPPPCDCKPCTELTQNQILIKRIILASKIMFLGSSIIFMWFIGGLGPTWDTWNLKECVKNYYWACKNIEYVYKDKCKPVPEEDCGPLCRNTQLPWNNGITSIFDRMVSLFYMTRQLFMDMLNFEYCEYQKSFLPKTVGSKTETKKEEKPDYRKIYDSFFTSLDPVNIPCGEPRDYYAELSELLREDDD